MTTQLNSPPATIPGPAHLETSHYYPQAFIAQHRPTRSKRAILPAYFYKPLEPRSRKTDAQYGRFPWGGKYDYERPTSDAVFFQHPPPAPFHPPASGPAATFSDAGGVAVPGRQPRLPVRWTRARIRTRMVSPDDAGNAPVADPINSLFPPQVPVHDSYPSGRRTVGGSPDEQPPFEYQGNYFPLNPRE